MRTRPTRTTTPVVALLTDFGLSDHYVAAVKSIILSRNPRTTFVDITHDIEPGNVRAASYALWAVRRSLPERAVVLTVVDPGVGTERDILIARSTRVVHVAPDNGVLDFVLSEPARWRLIRCTADRLRTVVRGSVSATFHGRDVFAPIAAALAAGSRPSSFGEAVERDPPGEWRVHDRADAVRPAIVSVDRFGNLVTNIVASDMDEARRRIRAVSLGKVMISVHAETYGRAPANTPCMIAGSSGLLEICVANGSAAQMLRANDRSPVSVMWRDGA